MLTIIIPAYNEEQSIGTVVADLKAEKLPFVKQILVVSDGSTDRTDELAIAAGAMVIRHAKNRGYGAAIKTGIRAAQTEFVMTMDSDGQHRVQDIRALWEQGQEYELTVGKRGKVFHSPLWRMPGKWMLKWMSDYLTKTKIPDLNSGLRMFRREVILRYLHLCSEGFSFSTTSTLVHISRGYNVLFVPIEVNKRVGRSLVTMKTGFDAIIIVLRIMALFNPLRIFIPLSFFISVVGVIWGIPYLVAGRGFSVLSALCILTGILLFSVGLLCDQISQLRMERFEDR